MSYETTLGALKLQFFWTIVVISVATVLCAVYFRVENGRWPRFMQVRW